MKHSLNEDGKEIEDDYYPVCIHSHECCLDNCEDSRPFSERPFYREYCGPELGNLLFGNSHGEYPVVPREEMQDVFVDFLDKLGCDMYGIAMYDTENKVLIYPGNTKEIKTGFGNEVFEIHPYYWGDDDELCETPNFIYRPEGLELRWYKYPMRDSYSNIKLTAEKLREICGKCLESLSQ